MSASTIVVPATLTSKKVNEAAPGPSGIGTLTVMFVPTGVFGGPGWMISQSCRSGVWSTLPSRSTARTSSVCGPSASDRNSATGSHSL